MNRLLQDPNHNELLEFIAKRMMIIIANPEETLVKEGEGLECKRLYQIIILENDNMYFIASGKCVVEQKDFVSAKTKLRQICIMHPGEYFGVRDYNIDLIIVGDFSFI